MNHAIINQDIQGTHSSFSFSFYLPYRNQGGRDNVILRERPVFSYSFYQPVHNELACANVLEFKSAYESQVKLLTDTQ